MFEANHVKVRCCRVAVHLKRTNWCHQATSPIPASGYTMLLSLTGSVRILLVTRMLNGKPLDSIVKPVREFLYRGNGGPQDTPSSWIIPRWINPVQSHAIRVACTADLQRQQTSTRIPGSLGHFCESPLASVMGFLPLREAFGEYCRKALCSEVMH